MNVFKELSKFKKVKYHDEPHKYFIGEQELISGTAFIGKFKEKFDSKAMAEKTAKKKGIPAEEVLADWDYRGDISRTKGTLLHNFAENYWQNKIFPIDYSQYDERFGAGVMEERLEACKKMFIDFYTDSSNTLVPVAMELVVGDEDLGIGGMVDCLFWNQKHGELQIWDYKTNKEIAEFSKYKKKMLMPINFLQECELNAYSIQLNLYKYIIERNTNLKIGQCYLVHIHEDQDQYNVIQCKEYQDIIELLIKHHKSTINN
jgi:ATP-dependent exoDNAse (exonuclease V) beta subunit